MTATHHPASNNTRLAATAKILSGFPVSKLRCKLTRFDGQALAFPVIADFPVIKSLIQLATRTSVQPQWDGRLVRRDEPSRTSNSGETWWARSPDGGLSVRAAYV